MLAGVEKRFFRLVSQSLAPPFVESAQFTNHTEACPLTRSTKGADTVPEKALTVFVVDDDESVRKALKRLLRVHGYHVITFESAEDFLGSGWLRTEGCIVLDMRLPGMSGPELYDKLASIEAVYPVIFMTAHDTPQWQEYAATKAGVAYLRKPFDQQSLLDAVDLAANRIKTAVSGSLRP
jgi:FixJ family two-component response regulator